MMAIRVALASCPLHRLPPVTGGFMDRPITAAAVVVVSFVLLLSVAGTAAGAPQVPATRGAPAWTDWSRVRNLAPGDEITVTTTAWAHQEYRMAFADDSLLIVVKPLDRLSPAVL